jgi:DNA-binding NarL/FixJ family response regulator
VNARILLVDDHEIVREGIRTLLAKMRPEWEICGEAADANQAIEAVKTLKPDLVTLDITMPGVNGIELVPRLKNRGVPCRILIFTTHESAQLAGEINQAGAEGYVMKSQAVKDLVVAIETLLSGGKFFGSAVQQQNKRSAQNDDPGSSGSSYAAKA